MSCKRVSQVLDFLVLQVHQEYLELKVSLDQREIQVSLATQADQDDLGLMDFQALKVKCSICK